MLNFKKSKLKFFVLLLVCLITICNFSFATENDILVEPRTADDEPEAVVTSLEHNDVALISSNSETTESDLFLFQNIVNINNDVDGNVFVMAKAVNINSTIYGNVFILAESVNIGENADIYNDVFICANTIDISGSLYDLYSVSTSVKINNSANIIRDVNIGCDSFTLNGYISRNANISCESINFNTVGAQYAGIGGNLSYSSSSELNINESIVAGDINYTEIVKEDFTGNIVKDYALDLLKVLIVSLIVILILVFAAPKFVDKQYSMLTTKTLTTLGYGLLALFVIPLVCIILFFTVIGIIPALAILFAYIFIISISPAIVAIPLGKLICAKMNKQSNGFIVLMSMVCVLIIWILTNIPILGGFFSLATAIFALGILICALFIKKSDKGKEIIQENTAEK